jgi:serine/threonine protein kinase/TolB-like protein
MTPERWQKVIELAEAASSVEHERRPAFLIEACSDDDDLRHEVESILASDEHASSFIEQPAVDLAGDVFAEAGSRPSKGKQFGPYEILDLLGTGGMGEVYLALDTRLDRKVALKFLAADLTNDPARVRRFQREARAASALNHPNIVTIYETGELDSTYFIATEYVDGYTLRKRIQTSPLELDTALDIARQVVNALSAAHQAGIVHRDIKPENIMVRTDGLVKVLDLGLAKLVEQQQPAPQNRLAAGHSPTDTEPGLIMGTPKYMSPEQVRGLKVDGRSDIFSLGVVLYEMVAGRVPFDGDTTGDVIAALLTAEPAPLSHGHSRKLAHVQVILGRALSKTVEGRYQSAQELLNDFGTTGKRIDIEERDSRRERLRDASALPRSVVAAAGAIVARGAAHIIAMASQHKYVSVVITLALLAAIGFAERKLAGGRKLIDSLAILPLANVGGDPNLEYLTEGITENLIDNLSRMPNLKVMSRASVLRYKDRDADPQAIGRDLHVRAVLIGRVVQQGTDLSITLELVDIADNSRLWGEQYNRRLSDVLAIQAEVSREVAVKLRSKITGEEQNRVTKQYTNNAEAYMRYLKGRYYWGRRTKASIEEGISYFQQAINLDPNFALAYAGLADSYHVLWVFSNASPRDNYQQVKAAVLKALEIDDTLAEAHASLGAVKVDDEWDFVAGENEYRRAIELNPKYTTAHQWYAEYLANMGRFDEALAEVEQAIEVDPLSLNLNTEKGYIFLRASRYDEAVPQLLKVIGLDASFVLPHNNLGDVYAEQGLIEKAIFEHQTAATLAGETPNRAADRAASLRKAYASRGVRGYWEKRLELALQSVHEEQVLSRALSDASAYHIAGLYARLGKADEAFQWLEKAFDERDDFILNFRFAPQFDGIRSDPRAVDLIRRIGIPQP